MNYACNLCNYSSYIKTHFNKHLKTNKHNRNLLLYQVEDINVENIPHHESTNEHKMSTNEHKMSTNEHKMSTNEHKMSTNIAQLINPLECEYCKKKFKTKPNLRRHIKKYCKNKKLLEQELIKEIKKDKQIEILQKTVNKLMDKVGNTTIHNNNNQVQNNVQLNCFGKENLSMLTDKIKKELIKGPFKMMPKLLELIYFNKDHPENHTMKLVNKNKEIMKIKDKNGWKLVDKNETVDYILEDNNYTVDNYYDNNGDKFSHFVKHTYKNFRKLFDSRDIELWKQIKRDVDLLLWNNM
jgi:hypothetical protein